MSQVFSDHITCGSKVDFEILESSMQYLVFKVAWRIWHKTRNFMYKWTFELWLYTEYFVQIQTL